MFLTVLLLLDSSVFPLSYKNNQNAGNNNTIRAHPF